MNQGLKYIVHLYRVIEV